MIDSRELVLGLDTDVLAEKKLLAILRKIPTRVFLSAIVLTEQAIWLRRSDWPLDKIKKTADLLNAEEVHYTSALGLLVAETCARTAIKFKQHARDVMIGIGYLKRGSIVLTNNTRHYRWVNKTVLEIVGISREWQEKKWVYTAQEVLEKLETSNLI
ncbi:MAG: type II toxin-antitoxin system VapC family toxin [Candidatus Hodarchaeales archaeon]|jgi:predicted nucleic acid-binding protein